MTQQTKAEISRILIEEILPNQLEQWTIETGFSSSLKLAIQKFKNHYDSNGFYLTKMHNLNEWITYINEKLKILYSHTNKIHEDTGIAPFKFGINEAMDLWNEKNKITIDK